MQDFIGMFEKVASKRPLYERYLRMYERIARTSPGVNASNAAHWTKRNDKWFELAGKKYQNMPLEDKLKYHAAAGEHLASNTAYEAIMRGYSNNKVMPKKELAIAKDNMTKIHNGTYRP